MTDKQLNLIRNHLKLTDDTGPVTDTATERRLTEYARALLAEVERLRTHEGELQTFAGRLAFYAEAYAVHAEQAGYVGDANVARRVVSEYRVFLAENDERTT